MRIAITGIGIISALGTGQAEHRQRLAEGRTAQAAARILPTRHHEWPMGEVSKTNAELQAQLGLQTEQTRNVLLGLTALREALADAGLDAKACAETTLVNGTTVGGMDLTEQHYAAWRQGEHTTLALLHQHEAAYTTHTLAEQTGLQEGTTFSTACSSALNAMMGGAALLRTGQASRVVVGGTEAMTIFHLNGFAALGILSERICRPFQADRDGINLGEGAAYLVLEDEAEAQKRGQKIYGYLAGYANRCDAYHQTASSPEGDGAYDAMCAALQMAGVDASEVPYVNAHGTATPNNDASEMRAIERLFGEKLPVVESTKPLTGHTTSASGSIEAIFTLLRMEEHGYPYAISNAFGFGGNDSSIVLSRGAGEMPTLPATPAIRQTTLQVSHGEWDYKAYIPAMQARRMTPMMRQLIVAAHKAIEEAGIETVDGIIVGTRWGGMIPTMQLLNSLIENGEQDFSPAQFMNSTHNGAAGTLARILNCKGYNTTVVVSHHTFEAAEADARLILATGEAKRILVCAIDEVDADWQSLLDSAQIESINEIKAEVLCID